MRVLVAGLLLCVSFLAQAQVTLPPGPINFGGIAPTVGHCAKIGAIGQDGVQISDAGAACSTGSSTLPSTQVGYGSGANALSGVAGFTYNATTGVLTLSNGSAPAITIGGNTVVTAVTGSSGVTAATTGATTALSLSPIAGNNILGNPTGSPATPIAISVLPVAFSLGSAASVYDVTAYGAKCDRTTDDTTAINNAFAAARTNYGAANNIAVRVVFPANNRCVITGTINATGFTNTANSLIVDGQGADLISSVSGAAIIDDLGSLAQTWNNISITVGSGTPTYGFQFGRTANYTTNGGGAQTTFNNVSVAGAFSGAACYNFSSEEVLGTDLSCINTSATGGYGLIQDGANHFSITSAFVSETAPVDSYQPFSLNTFIRGRFTSFAGSNGAPVWIETPGQHRFIGSYALNTGTGGSCVQLWSVTATGTFGVAEALDFDMHCESSNTTNYFLITGPGTGGPNFTATPRIRSLTYRDSYLYPSGSIFAIASGSNITTVNLNDLHVVVDGGPTSPTVTMFDVPGSYNAQGTGFFYNTAIWNGSNTKYFSVEQNNAVNVPAASIWGYGVTSSGTQMTLAAGSAGALTGTYYYSVTYVTAEGETEPAYTVSGVTVSSQQVNISAIPVSTNPFVTARKIYRTIAGQTIVPYIAQLVTTISDNTTTTYTDNAADGTLGAFEPGINTTIPQISSTNYGRMLGWGNQSLSLGYLAMGASTGYADTALGTAALSVNTSGVRNTAVGEDSLVANTTGNDNTAVGTHALGANIAGSDEVAVGYTALFSQAGVVTGGGASIAVGYQALLNSNVSGGASSVALGYQALAAEVAGTSNVAVGSQAGASLTGSSETIVGTGAAGAGTSANGITAFGTSALAATTGAANTGIGRQAGLTVVAGANNTIVGAFVGSTTLVSGSSNVLVGTSNATTTVAASTSGEVNIDTVIMGYATAPTVTSGGGTSPTVTGNGTFLFVVTEGATGTPGTALVLGMSTAPTDWACDALDRTSTSITARQTGAASTTAATITFSSAPANSDVIQIKCLMR